MISNSLIVLLIMSCVLSLSGTLYYRKYAIKNGILANLNFRTLHEKPTPRGGGIIFSLVFCLSILFLYFFSDIELNIFLVFGVGGTFAAIIGYIDDLRGITALIKLFLQLFISLWALFWLDGGPLNEIIYFNGWPAWALSVFLMVWLINVYNFIDGIDGMAITGAVLILSTLFLTLIILNSSSHLGLLFLILIASCCGFLFFNWPKATLFMGDSGSIFLGYIFGAFIIYSTMKSEISLYTWLVVFGYYLADTTSTSVIRLLTVKNWYHTHRSHAYQNLARILNNHSKVTAGIIFYHLLWLLPLAVLTVIKPSFSILAVFLAFLPSTIWSIKFGPFYSKD
jgi:Fuc2NAc and GlcNAc transferase